ncbi:MAG TPA: MFS transporter, partial [Vicinamibacterales bacterium]|nr:MFS transporter [Vicinamibacterales bacterium]
MTRPLLVIFLTILVNLIGFGIIVPLLPFYAQTFGASPFVIGMLFASFSISQLVASPILGAWSDRWGRRPVLIFSLLGTVVSFTMMALARNLAVLFAARIVDGLSGGNITTARAYIGDVTDESNRARAFGMLGAAFGLGFIIGPAIGGLFAKISYTAPIWAAAIITVVAMVLAWLWLPETVHKVHAVAGSPWRALGELSARPGLRVLFTVDFLYWTCFAIYQGTFALFGEARFKWDATQIGYILAVFGVLGVVVQGALVAPTARAIGERRMLTIGLVLAAVSWGASAFAHQQWVFIAMLVPGSLGVGFCNPSLISMLAGAAGRHEQGRVLGAAGALESLGRTIGPMWGNGALEWFGDSSAYASAAVLLVVTAALSLRYTPASPP